MDAAGRVFVSCRQDGRIDVIDRDFGVTSVQVGAEPRGLALDQKAGRLADTAPYNWEGSAATLEENIRQTVHRRFIVQGLRPVTRPVPTLDPSLVAQGRHLFHDAVVGCAGCHPSDGASHDVGSMSRREDLELRQMSKQAPAPSFNTPDLRQRALTAPYLHDGSAKKPRGPRRRERGQDGQDQPPLRGRKSRSGRVLEDPPGPHFAPGRSLR
ncbi:MAG: hypothetical protein ACOZIN_19945 [Myxococcota bacterium]